MGRVSKILLIFFGIFCGLLIGEYSLRIYEKFSDSIIGVSQMERIYIENKRWWGLAKLGRHGKRDEKEAAYIISNNPSLFYEPTEWFYTFKKRLDNNPHAYRIFVLGDSTTRLGPGVDFDVNFYPYFLENMLNNDNKNKFIVINCGIPGYATQQEVEFLEKKLLKFKPHFVIIGYFLNDKDIKHRILKKKGYYFCADLESKVPIVDGFPFNRDLYIHSELYKLINCYLVHICKALNLKISYFDLGSYNTIKVLRRFKTLSNIYNFKTSFVIFPYLEYSNRNDYETEWIKINLKKIEIDFIDMKNIFYNYGIEKLKIKDEDKSHFNDTGHMLIAKELYDYLAKENKLDYKPLIKHPKRQKKN